MIRDQVRSVLEDGQLDECDLTLGDLARVEDAFLDVLSGMYHSRIEYPEEATQGADKAAETAMPEPS
jgi:membrane-associated HD superfamily phosphohydrolase